MSDTPVYPVYVAVAQSSLYSERENVVIYAGHEYALAVTAGMGHTFRYPGYQKVEIETWYGGKLERVEVVNLGNWDAVQGA